MTSIARTFANLALAAASSVLALASSCATAQAAKPTAAATTSTATTGPVADENVVVDVEGLFPAQSSRTVGDSRAIHAKLLQSMSLERNAVTGTDGVEPWLSRVLLAWLVEHGAEVRTSGASTAKLVGVRFVSLKQDASVSVSASDGAVSMRYWGGDKDISDCAPAMKISLTYVQLEGVLVDANDRFVASFGELVAVPPQAKKQTVARKGRDSCALAVDVFAQELAPTEGELVDTARAALDAGFRALVPDQH
jgi:hypothetical protein